MMIRLPETQKRAAQATVSHLLCDQLPACGIGVRQGRCLLFLSKLRTMYSYLYDIDATIGLEFD